MCPAAARRTDPIAHTSTMGMLAKMAGSLIVGALVGAAATMAVAALVVTGPVGWVALLAIGFAVSVVMEASGINEFIDRAVSDAVDGFIPKTIEGKIISGSTNVTINSLPAARAAAPGARDIVLCAKHGGNQPPMIAQGSDNIFINDHPAARKGDKTTCGGTIAEGSENVFFGGGTLTVRKIKDERPWWIAALGVAIGAALALCGRGKMNMSALKSALPCLAMNFASSFAGSMVGHMIRTTIGHPVNVITGGKILREPADFSLPGPIPLEWIRVYSSHDRREGSQLGVGWSMYNEVQLTVERDPAGQLSSLCYCDDQGRQMSFPPVLPGESHYSTAEGYYLICTALGQYLVESTDGLFRDFGVPPVGFAGALKLQRLEDRNGNWHAFRYDVDNVLRMINDCCGRQLEFIYDDVHRERIAEIRLTKGADSEPTESLVRYNYSAEGMLTEVIDRLGQTRRKFGYKNGLMVEHSVPGGLSCNYDWMGSGADARVIKHWTDDGESYGFTYDLVRAETTVTDQIGRIYRWVWSADKQPISYIDPEGHCWRYEWDQNRQLVASIDPLGAITSHEYDEAGHLITTKNALDQISTAEWDLELDLLIAETDAAGNRWAYKYDERGNLLVLTDPEGNETEQFFDRRGLPHTIRDAHGGYKHMAWNSRAQMTSYTDCSGKVASICYDERGALTGYKDALGRTTKYEVDSDDQVTAIVHPDGSEERFQYDATGQLRSSRDTAGHETLYLRNIRGQLTQRVDPLGHKVRLEYDHAYRLASVLNENQERYRFSYDRNDHVIEETGLDGTVRHIQHDPRGLPISVTDAVGEPDALTLHMQRDALGRLVGKHARGRSTCFRYDNVGQLLEAQQYTYHGGSRAVHDTLHFSYSKRGELLSETGHLGKLSHHYDALGNCTSTALPDGRVINRLFYGFDNLHQINVDGVVISDFERDDIHRELSRSQGRLTTRFEYDAVGRKTAARSNHAEQRESVLQKEWIYDPACEVKTKRHSLNGQTNYIYDPLGRVRVAITKARSELQSWDAAANLVASGQQAGYVKNNRLVVFEDKRFDYDTHGRLEKKRTGAHTEQNFTYDGEHRLQQVETLRHKISEIVSFEYDALGRRIRKTSSAGTTLFLWDGLHLVQELEQGSSTTYIYEDINHAPLARVEGSRGRPASTSTANDREFPTSTNEASAAGVVYYFHNDVSGIPEEMTGSDGKLCWKAQYSVWGKTLSESWVHGGAALSRGSEFFRREQNLRFQGQYFDRETGLHYNTFRFYDPDIGKFITQDPIGIAGGLNLYSYAPNPVTWIDPWGLQCNSTLSAPATINRGSRIFSLEQGFAAFGWKHIYDRHISRLTFPNKSKFHINMTERDIIGALAKTLKHGRETSFHGDPVFTARVKFGNSSRKYRVTVSKTTGQVITFHPIG